MSNIINLEDARKETSNKNTDPKLNVLLNIESRLKEFINDNGDKDAFEEFIYKTTSNNKDYALTVYISYAKNEERLFSFDEWLDSQKNTVFNIRGQEYSDINTISSYSFGILITDLTLGKIMSLELLRMLIGINEIALHLNRRTVITPIKYMYGLIYGLESNNHQRVLLTVCLKDAVFT